MSIGIKGRDHRPGTVGLSGGLFSFEHAETATPLPAPTADLRGQLVFAAKTAEKEKIMNYSCWM